ncbi:MAG: dienelactone hydrolase family protein [Herpetosiphonaceae bacterium]|nr:dienelactone hydrolase family protein [Herpetosiphonaceae bacterium]
MYTTTEQSNTLTEQVSFPYGATTKSGYLAEPTGSGPFPALVVIHEAFGLNPNIKDITERFTKEGYVALAVDLFDGGNRVLCMVRIMTSQLLHPLDGPTITQLKAALTYLAARPEVDGQRLGAIGFCLGGGLAITWACTDKRLRAIAPYYAPNPRPLEAVTRACPVVGSYPGKDFTTAAGRTLEATLERAGTPHDIKIYPGARHSFFNDTSRAYDAAAAADSWQRVLAFFQEHIKGPTMS